MKEAGTEQVYAIYANDGNVPRPLGGRSASAGAY